MSAEIINLRQARKQRARAEKAARGAENRARFGRSKLERERKEQSHARAEQALDGHLREPQSAAAPTVGPGAGNHETNNPAPKPPR
jgi:hypothetical protein